MKPSLRFLYVFCNDLASMRRFYSDLIGLEEIYHDSVSLAYKCDELQFTIFQTEQRLHASNQWGMQPGWDGGTQPGISWSIQCSETFSAAVDRLREAGVSSYYPVPQWFGYWSFPVKDPAGNTVEITCPEDIGDKVPQLGWGI